MRVQSLGWADALEIEMATHSIFFLGKSHGQRSLVGYSPGGYKESDKTVQLSTHKHTKFPGRVWSVNTLTWGDDTYSIISYIYY